jgi:HEPN domain-containing protein
MVSPARRVDAMTSADLKDLARERLREARALLRARCWSGAYYLAGYAVECGLKACIIKRLLATDQFPDRKFSEQCWTHKLEQLFEVAGLKEAFRAALAADPDLWAHWDILKDWSEASRYVCKSKGKAANLYRAIADKKHGVLSWIKARW